MFLITLLACPTPTGLDSGTRDSDTEETEPLQGTLRVTPGVEMVTQAVLTAEFEVERDLELLCTSPVAGELPEQIRWSAESAAPPPPAPLRGLLAAPPYTCDVVGAELAIEFTTGPLPAALAAHRLTLETWEPEADLGWTLLAPFLFESADVQPDVFFVVVDMEGRVRWYVEPDEGDGVVAFDYNPEARQFWAGGGLKDSLPATSYDLDGHQTARLSTKADHDVDWFEDSAWSLLATRDTFCIEERAWATDEVQWTLCGDEVDQADFQLNSLDVRREGGDVVIYGGSASTRRIIKLHRDRRELLWQLSARGDFEGIGTLSFTHDVNGVDCDGYESCVLYYENGTEALGSAVRVWGLDETAGVATEVFSWTEEGWYEPRMGGAQLLDGGSVLVSRSHVESMVPGGPDTSIVEVSPDEEVLWKLVLSPVDRSTYRARRVDPCEIFDHAGYCPAD